MRLLVISWDLVREAASRRWILALAVAVTLALLAISSILRMEVVEGTLAVTRLFGTDVHASIRSVDVALRPLFRAATYVVFYGGLGLGIALCADFAPELLAPGRIEHLLAQPVRRWELLFGTFLGVWILAAAGSLYGAGGFALILGLKTGVWVAGPFWAGVVASIVFVAIYAVMLTAALFVRSAAFSALMGFALTIGGIITGYREGILHSLTPGVGRDCFLWITMVLPPISRVADLSADLAASQPIVAGAFARPLLGIGIFGVASLSLAVWWFERKDF